MQDHKVLNPVVNGVIASEECKISKNLNYKFISFLSLPETIKKKIDFRVVTSNFPTKSLCSKSRFFLYRFKEWENLYLSKTFRKPFVYCTTYAGNVSYNFISPFLLNRSISSFQMSSFLYRWLSCSYSRLERIWGPFWKWISLQSPLLAGKQPIGMRTNIFCS